MKQNIEIGNPNAVRRYSYDEFDQIARDYDQITAGEVCASNVFDGLENLGDDRLSLLFNVYVSENGLDSWREIPCLDVVDLSRTLSNNSSDNPFQDKDPSKNTIERKIESYELIVLGHVTQCIKGTSEILNKIKDPEKQLKPRESAIAQLATEFLAELDAVGDISQLTTGQALNFIKTSSKKIAEQYEENQTIETIEAARDELVDLLQEEPTKIPKMPAEFRRIAASTIKNIPITIVNPFEALLVNNDADDELFGKFSPEARHAYIDPFSIANEAEQSTDPVEAYRIQLKAVLFHELFHASAGSHYVETTEFDLEPQPEVAGPVWPLFVVEAMTEKLAWYALAAIESPKNTLALSNHEKYGGESDFARGVLETTTTRKLKEQYFSSYVEFRDLLDLLIEKSDWSRLGVSRLEAEALLILAYVETPVLDERSVKAWPDRKMFMSMLNKATNPGFFNRISILIDQIGIDSTLMLVGAPDFDASDPQSVPMITKPTELWHIQEDIKSLNRYKGLLHASHYDTEGNELSKIDKTEMDKNLDEVITAKMAMRRHKLAIKGLKHKIAEKNAQSM